MELIQAHLGGADDPQQRMNKSKSPTPSLDGSGKTQPQNVVEASNSGTENTPASPSSCTHLARCAAVGSPNSTTRHISGNDDELACLPTQLRHTGRLLPSSRESFDLACRTPLPRPDQKELVVLAVDPQDLPAAAAADSAVVEPVGPSPRLGHEFMPKTAMEQQEDVNGIFGAGPLSVPGGLAVTEEGVEMGIADVATTNVG